MTKEQALQKIKELKFFIQEQNEWIGIDYSVIPKEIFDKYGAKPFGIMKYKMRNDDGNVWNDINYFNAQRECKKLGYRLPNIQEMLVLLNWYKQKNKKVFHNDKEFLGIEELSYAEDVCHEWIFNLDDVAFLRGGHWHAGAGTGAFALRLGVSPADSGCSIGFRCVR